MNPKPPASNESKVDWTRSLSGLGAALALAASLSLLVALTMTTAALETPGNLMALALAVNLDEAQSVLASWVAAGHLAAATDAIRLDYWFILAYTLTGILAALWAARIARPLWVVPAIVVVLFLGAAGFDLLENVTLQSILDRLTVSDDLLVRVRFAAIVKFSLFQLGVAGVLILVGAALRVLAARTVSATDTGHKKFSELIEAETAGIFSEVKDREEDDPQPRTHAAADEPRVAFRSADVIGLALSGGGIRSATFNLGLLQGMHRRNLLKLFDYLSTVSGGGYIGSFWSEYLKRQKKKREKETDPEKRLLTPSELFPSGQGGDPTMSNQVDSPHERHLREFSKFLAPRWGFFEVEMWTAIVALLAGLIPALAIGLAVIGLGLVVWLALMFPLAWPGTPAAAIVVALITIFVFGLFEKLWRSVKAESAGLASAASDQDSARVGHRKYWVFACVALVAVALVQAAVPWVYRSWVGHEVPWIHVAAYTSAAAATGQGLFDQWWSVIGVRNYEREAWVVSPRLFDYGFVWLAVAAAFVVGRLAYALSPSRWRRETLAAYDRVLMRLIGISLFWVLTAAIWHLVINLHALGTGVLAATGVATGGLFAALRNWIGVALRQPNDSRLLTRLKPYLPQLLAYLTIVVAVVLVGRLLVSVGSDQWLVWWQAAGAMMLLAIVGLFIEPANYGLHAFYRERLSRAYTGACNLAPNEGAEHNRATDPRSGDDRKISELADRPLHLVCCAANDLSGDTVQTLGRGARSAVLSKFGLSLGGYWAETPHVWLGSAITASAAAFNSNMGMVSMRVGPAVAFLMTSLNLRLGLWLRHPAAGVERLRRWPGLLIYREMFGKTSASGKIQDGAVPLFMRDIHLSDGAHFENLALYELVRRHCRYILVSDCGSDPTVAFDDLGNALRRVREDFGIDISIDVEPLKPDPVTGLSKQHVAIGTIHYSPTDRGILLYVKPTLTGDEPPDVGQYKTRNAAFPHETTGDQFYDEAQYESYRRLGIHAADSVFDFVPPNPAIEPASGGRRSLTADWVFVEAFHRWGPTPPGLADRILEMTSRVGDLEMDLQRQGRVDVLQEAFPELRYVDDSAKALNTSRIAITGKDLPLLLRMAQIMEDVWIACQLDDWWEHPLNLGWVNLFARWATSPSFRFWWPVFAPMYNPGFRDFVNERFPTPSPRVGSKEEEQAYVPQRGRVVLVGDREPEGLTETWWKTRATQPMQCEGRSCYQNLITLPTPDDSTVEIQVGLAAVATQRDKGSGAPIDAGWTSHDFFVPPSLWGASIGWHFLVGLLDRLREDGYQDCYVVVKAVPYDVQHRFAFDDRHSFIKQYRKIGFRQESSGTSKSSEPRNEGLLKELGFKEPGDTLFKLNLPQWHKRRRTS